MCDTHTRHGRIFAGVCGLGVYIFLLPVGIVEQSKGRRGVSSIDTSDTSLCSAPCNTEEARYRSYGNLDIGIEEEGVSQE
jgi:hypothetical protein